MVLGISPDDFCVLTRVRSGVFILYWWLSAIEERHAVIDRVHEFYVAHAVVGNLLVAPSAEFIVDATSVNPLPLRALHPQNLGQPIKRHILAWRPLVPLVHGVEDGPRAVAGERQFDRGTDTLDDAPLVEEGQVEVKHIVTDDKVA